MNPSAPRLASVLAWVAVVLPTAVAVSPWMADASTLPGADWDVELAHRLLVVEALRGGHMPFWNPFACGGVPAWGFIEGATTLVSPWLLPYMVLPLALALRVETVGSAILGAVGAYFAAGRLTRSSVARAFVVVLWAVDGRWALQARVGHTWHLVYAWMPWAFYFFDRSCESDARWRGSVLLGGTFALMLYGGGIYPLPHTALALGLYAAGIAVAERTWRPVARLALAGGLGMLLAAPKLLPMLHVYATTPRRIASDERLPLDVLWAALTSRDPGVFRLLRSHGLPYGWHEYGLYVSPVGLCALLAASMAVWKPRENALRAAGVVFFLLGLGAFSSVAPWSLLHAYGPFFSSQHVPTRFLYPAVLLLALAGAPAVGLLADWLARKRAWLEPALALVVVGLSLDVALVARESMVDAAHLRLPPIEAGSFHQNETAVLRALPLVASTLGNYGVVRCYGMLEHATGARSVTDPRYHGEAYVSPPSDAPGTPDAAAVQSFLPDRVVVDARAAFAGSTVVLDENYDDGWRSDDGEVVDVDDQVGVRIAAPRETVTFTYRPRGLAAGLVLGAIGLAACGWLLRRDRAIARAASA